MDLGYMPASDDVARAGRGASPPMRDPTAAADDAEPRAGFLVCSVATRAMRVLYADSHARRLIGGDGLVGTALWSLLEIPEPDTAHEAAGSGRTFHGQVRLATGRAKGRTVALRIQPLAAGDGNEPWALCSFETLADSSPAPSAVDDDAAAPRDLLDLTTFVRALAHRLRVLLPGNIQVGTVLPLDAIWVRASADVLEEIVASLLALSTPHDPWRHVVRLVVRCDGDGSHARLCFALVGDVRGDRAMARIPAELIERLTGLGLGLVADSSTGAGPGLALVMRSAACDSERVDRR